jgi:hypothetical protein
MTTIIVIDERTGLRFEYRTLMPARTVAMLIRSHLNIKSEPWTPTSPEDMATATNDYDVPPVDR